MGFEMLLGNFRLKENLQQAASKNRFSHFYLISGPVGSGKRTLARLLSAAMLCQDPHRPCMRCTACRKVLSDTHPDVITVDDPEKKTVPVDLIRQARADMYIQPNEADRKIYLFPRAQDMGIPGQNALLKVLEEPPSYGVFLLLTDNPENVLATVRSRCTPLAMQALPRDLLQTQLQTRFPQASLEAIDAAMERSGSYLGQAIDLLSQEDADAPQTQALFRSLIDADGMGILQVLVPMEKWKRDQLIPLLEQWAQILQQALLCRSGMPVLSQTARELGAAKSSQALLQCLQHIQKSIEYAQGNVSCAAICGYLEWALR